MGLILTLHIDAKLIEILEKEAEKRPLDPSVAEVIFRYYQAEKLEVSRPEFARKFGWKSTGKVRYWTRNWRKNAEICTLEIKDLESTSTPQVPCRNQSKLEIKDLEATEHTPKYTPGTLPGENGVLPGFEDENRDNMSQKYVGTDDAIFKKENNNIYKRGECEGGDYTSRKVPSRPYRSGLVDFEKEWAIFTEKNPNYSRAQFDNWVRTFEDQAIAKGYKYSVWSRTFKNWTRKAVATKQWPFDKQVKVDRKNTVEDELERRRQWEKDEAYRKARKKERLANG